MYRITQDESFELRRRFPNISIKVCSKRKKGKGSKTYWCEEGKAIEQAIEEIRSREVIT